MFGHAPRSGGRVRVGVIHRNAVICAVDGERQVAVHRGKRYLRRGLRVTCRRIIIGRIYNVVGYFLLVQRAGAGG